MTTNNKYLFLMTSREASQTYTGIDIPGERWRQLHVSFKYKLVYTFTDI